MGKQDHHSKDWGGSREGSGRPRTNKLYTNFTFRVETSIANDFKTHCAEQETSQAMALRELMKLYNIKHETDEPEAEHGDNLTLDFLIE